MRIKKKVLQKIISIFASVLLLVNTFTPYLLITPTFSSVKAQDEIVTPTQEPTATPTDAVSPAPTAEPTIAPTETTTPTPTFEVTPTETPTPTIEVTPTSEPTLVPTETASPTPTVEVAPTSESTVTPTITPTPIQTPSQWTFEKVELNKEYVAPQNSDVKLTFTKLPDPAGNIKIEEITLTEDQIKQTGSLSNKAYDITSDMKDGDFSYNLSLPIPESSIDKSVEVKFAEDISSIASAEKVENELTKSDTSVSVASLDHMTIFVVSGASTTAAVISLVSILDPSWTAIGGGGVYSAYIGPPAYDYVSPGSTSVYDGRESGIIKAGLTVDPTSGVYEDEGLFGFKPTVTINTLASGTLTYDVENQEGTNPVWMTIEIDTGVVDDRSDNTTYQFVPTTNPTGWHIVDAGAGQWQKWNNNSGDTTGNPLITLSAVATANTSKNVVRAYLRLGMGNSYHGTGSGTVAYVDKTTIGGVTYDFVVGAGSTPASCTGVSITLPGETAACYSTIQEAINAANSGDTINVAAGTYTEVGQIVIDKNLSIVGADKANTIIKPDVDYLDSWFVVNTGITFNLSKVTLDGTGRKINKAIKHQGSGVINDNYFTEIKNSSVGQGPLDPVDRDRLYAGTAIAIDSSEKVDITNNEFTQIGRNGILADGNTGTVSGNTYTGKGAGDWMDYFILSEYGDNVTISNNIISNNRGVALTDGSDSAGIAVWDDTNTTATINDNTFTNNSSGVAIAVINGSSTFPTVDIGTGNVFNNGDIGIAVQSVGAFGSPTLTVTGSIFSNNVKDITVDSGMTASNIIVHNSKFSGTTAAIANSGTGTIDANSNYWGSVCPDFGSIVSGSATHSSWYIDAGMTMLNSDIDSIFDGVSSSLASQGVASNIGDVAACNYTSFPNLYFEKSLSGTKMGKITFTASLDLSSEATQTFLQSLGTYMEANQGSMKFDARTATQLKEAGAEIKMYGINALGYTDIAPIIVKDDSGNILSTGDTNYPALTDITYSAGDNGTLTFKTSHFTQFDLPDQDQTTPDDGGNATANSDTPQVVITDPDKDVTVTVDGSIDATIDVSAFITDGEGDIPKITINSDNADVSIPGTKVTGPTGWDGVIAAPTVTTVTLPETSGETKTLSAGIELGFADGKLSFDNAVKIILPGQAGKRAGYSRPGTEFTEITTTCGENSQTWADNNLGADGECKIDVGLDLVIWTKHFTKFAAYTQTTNSSSSTSGSVVNNAKPPVCNDQKPGSAPTLLSAVAGFNSVTLTWSKASDPVSYYLMTFGTSSGSQAYGNPNIGNKDTTSYTVNGLSGGTTYYFKVRAGNGCTPGDFSNELFSTPTGGFIAGIPAGFAAGVLGAATSVADLTVTPELTPQPTPTTTAVNIGQVKAAVTRNFSKYILPIVLIILLTALIFYFYKRRSS